MNPVKRQDDHHDEVGREQPVIERGELVEMLKGLIGVVRTPVVAQAFGSEKNEGCGDRVQLGEGKQMRSSVVGSIDGQFELYATPVTTEPKV
jgi:hypothetical protein